MLEFTFELAQPDTGSEYVELTGDYETAADEYEPDDEVGFRGTRR